METKILFGIVFIDEQPEVIIRHLDALVEQKRKRFVSFVNAHTVNCSRKNEKYKEFLNRTLVLNDGVGVSLASKWVYGSDFKHNFVGTDFVPYYLAQTVRDLRIYLLGAQEHVVAATAAIIEERYPRHRVVGCRNGFFDQCEEERIRQEIEDAKPDILLLGMGNPRQELWWERNGDALSAPVAMGVGALFDYMSGAVPRAPRWVLALRSEWLFRLLVEPRRLWTRYVIGNITFLFALIVGESRKR